MLKCEPFVIGVADPEPTRTSALQGMIKRLRYLIVCAGQRSGYATETAGLLYLGQEFRQDLFREHVG
jgi:hypothetical protein